MFKKIAKNKYLISLILLIPCVLSGVLFDQVQWGRNLENASLDLRLQYSRQDAKAHEDIIVLLIDDASLNAMNDLVGRWPWDRNVWAELIPFLIDSGAKSIVFDILFTEVSEQSQEGLVESDLNLAMATEAGPIIHSFQMIKDTEDEKNKNLLNNKMPKEIEKKISFATNNWPKQTYNNFYLPFKELASAATGLGDVNLSPDPDGVYRHVSLFKNYQNRLFPSLGLVPYIKQKKIQSIGSLPEELNIGKITIPLTTEQTYLINPYQHFETYSLSGVFASLQAVMNGETDDLLVTPETFTDKTVFIGASAAGLDDLKHTSLGQLTPGVYLHAASLSNILKEDFIVRAPRHWIYPFFYLICFILGCLFFKIQHLFFKITPFLLFSGLYTLCSFLLLSHSNILIALSTPILSLALYNIILLMYQIIIENKDKRFLKKSFQNYISPELIDIMHEKEEFPSLGGEAGIKTAFFTDIQGFSSFSEQLSATKLVELLNEYLTDMTDILLDEKGTLDKYEGDAIIAFFGAPLKLEDHATRSCSVALKMQKRLRELTEHWKKQGEQWPAIVHNMKMRIGINSGDIVTGNMGSKKRMNYTMIGDAVNLAARLEESAKQYGVYSHVSKATKDLTDDRFLFRELDTIRVVGKKEAITSYELINFTDQASEMDKKLVHLFDQGLKHYKAQQWEQAIQYFEQALIIDLQYLSDSKITPSNIYIDRCKSFIQQPPGEDWDGVYTLTHK
jgi:adenylate cyclase